MATAWILWELKMEMENLDFFLVMVKVEIRYPTNSESRFAKINLLPKQEGLTVILSKMLIETRY